MKARTETGKVYSVEAQMSCLYMPAMRCWLGNYLQGEPLEITPLKMTGDQDSAYGEEFSMALLHYPNGVSVAKTCAAEPGVSCAGSW